jgi:hypothetical protein
VAGGSRLVNLKPDFLLWLPSHEPLPRRFIVRSKARLAIAAAILSAVVIAGCGGEEAKPVDVSKGADTTQFKGMLEQMKANVKADKSGRPVSGAR